MEQRRFIIFLGIALAIYWAWSQFVLPKFLPPPQAKQKQVQPQKELAAKDDKGAGEKDQAPTKEAKPAEVGATEKKDATEPAKPDDTGKPDEPEPPQTVKQEHPRKVVRLGSAPDGEPSPDYAMQVTLLSRGAAVSEIAMNDPRYRNLTKPHPALRVVGDTGSPFMTFQTSIPEIDQLVAPQADKQQPTGPIRELAAGLNSVDWEVVDGSQSDSGVTFRFTAPDGTVRVEKRYEVTKIAGGQSPDVPYSLSMELKLTNLSSKERTLNYVLQGPVGLPLENVDNATKFRDVIVGFTDQSGKVRHQLLAGTTITKGDVEEWREPLKYIGVDVQYFTALVLPGGDQVQEPYLKSSTQTLVPPKAKVESHNDLSVVLTSMDIKLAPANGKDAAAATVTHSYRLFAGPKRDEMLVGIAADQVIDYGWFGFVSRPMLSVMGFFYGLFGSYGLAIICLTVVVRMCLFPLSIKQARSTAKMQELQPEIAALKVKYANEKEKFARAQMELFGQHNYNPFGGCLVVFLQMPIFIGLYSALSHAVDLRLAPFLWVENLAGPDALFPFPWNVPFLGKEFNLLPIITISLFLLQQTLYMPKADPNDEQAVLQQKMMKYMMVFMGFMFYKVPAGLCVYFIASSCWGMAERKLLPKAKPKPKAIAPPNAQPVASGARNGAAPAAPQLPKRGLWAMLAKAVAHAQEAADKDQSARRDDRKR
jgi:YidC/Oxa1 family membrane protein insertase